MARKLGVCIHAEIFFLFTTAAAVWADGSQVGREVAIPRHLADGDEFRMGLHQLLDFGRALFTANWTSQEGGGRPMTKGTGAPLSDGDAPLTFPRNFNRISGPDANSCAGCHNAPFGIAGGGGDIVANVFVLGQRFDFATFDGNESPLPGTVGSHDESGEPVTLGSIANSRNTLGMFGSGYIELLAREVTVDLQAIRNSLQPGQSRALTSKGLSFGSLARGADGSWDTSRVEGLPAPSLSSAGPSSPPNLILRPFHQAGAVISLRQFTNNAFNHHHGIQTAERFGDDTDPDGDGFIAEMTRADVTAVSIFQATLAVPGRVIPHDPDVEAAVLTGERLFAQVGCTGCHVPKLPLADSTFSEPNPFNPAGNLQPGDAPDYRIDLNDARLPRPRLYARKGVTWVSAYTDLKLHDITSGPDDPNRETLDMNQPAGSAGFFAGNGKFLTRKLWGAANEPPFFHHGKYTTLREAVLAHHGEAQAVTDKFNGLTVSEQAAVIEFLKTLQVLPRGTRSRIVDERFQPRTWPTEL